MYMPEGAGDLWSNGIMNDSECGASRICVVLGNSSGALSRPGSPLGKARDFVAFTEVRTCASTQAS